MCSHVLNMTVAFIGWQWPLKGTEVTFMRCSHRMTQWYSLLETHCYRMLLHAVVYYITEEDIPWLVSIRAHSKSHVPLLLTARVLQSRALGLIHKVRLLKSGEHVCSSSQMHNTTYLIYSALMPKVGKVAVNHYNQQVKVENVDVSEVLT